MPKLVFAHHIVGLTASYTVDDWKADITLAEESGIDGFALNVGKDTYTPEQAENAHQAAEQLNSNFKLFFSFDMTSCSCATADDAYELRFLTLQYATRPSQLQVDGKAFVSTFAGEACEFGHGDSPGGWRAEFTQHSDIVGKIHFVPTFFVDPATFSQYTGAMDGYFTWNAGWPIELTVASASELLPGIDMNNMDATAHAALQKHIGSFAPDNTSLAGLANLPDTDSPRTYIAPISPWFFTHFAPDTYDKNWVYVSDEHLFAARWESVIAHRDSVDLVELLTWNDFGESSYLSQPHPGQAMPPGADAWVDGFDHTGWLRLVRHYAAHFKTGQAPSIEEDEVVMWARPHPKNAMPAPPGDPVGPPRDFQLLQDTLWAVVLARADGELTLSGGEGNEETFEVRAGVNKVSLPLAPNGCMRAVLTRDGRTVVDLRPEEFTFDPNPTAFNYNAFVASAVTSERERVGDLS